MTTITASLGLITISEADILSVVLTSPDVAEDFTTSTWLIKFSDHDDYTNLAGPVLLGGAGIVVATSTLTFVLSPIEQGLTVPADQSGTYKDGKDYYFDILQTTGGGVRQLRGQCRLHVFRAISKP